MKVSFTYNNTPIDVYGNNDVRQLLDPIIHIDGENLSGTELEFWLHYYYGQVEKGMILMEADLIAAGYDLERDRNE